MSNNELINIKIRDLDLENFFQKHRDFFEFYLDDHYSIRSYLSTHSRVRVRKIINKYYNDYVIFLKQQQEI